MRSVPIPLRRQWATSMATASSTSSWPTVILMGERQGHPASVSYWATATAKRTGRRNGQGHAGHLACFDRVVKAASAEKREELPRRLAKVLLNSQPHLALGTILGLSQAPPPSVDSGLFVA